MLIFFFCSKNIIFLSCLLYIFRISTQTTHQRESHNKVRLTYVPKISRWQIHITMQRNVTTLNGLIYFNPLFSFQGEFYLKVSRQSKIPNISVFGSLPINQTLCSQINYKQKSQYNYICLFLISEQCLVSWLLSSEPKTEIFGACDCFVRYKQKCLNSSYW